MTPDFSGYVTKYGVKCADGRTIIAHAFNSQDGERVPLVWQHQHNDPANVLGHLVLRHRDDGVYADAFFNGTAEGQRGKALVKHGDIKALSIYANQLAQQGANVIHGMIREGSLVMAGANPGAYIDDLHLAHGIDPSEIDLTDFDAIIHTDEEIEVAHAVDVSAAKPAAKTPSKGPMPEPSGDNGPDDKTVQEIYNDMTPEQQNVVAYFVGEALNHTAQSGFAGNEEGSPVGRNVFDQTQETTPGLTLSHADVKGIMTDAQSLGSLKKAVESYAVKHGIDDIDVMFPEAKLLQDQPDFIARRSEWVAGVLSATRKSPFSRVKTILADITQDQARAKGYIKGNMKEEEFFGVTRRTTTPTTVYKKQKLDRDDILDVTDFNMVTWLQGEMRLQLDEEVARAILIGDGRSTMDPDKIKDPIGSSDGTGIRSVLNDNEVYVTNVYVNIDDADSSPDEIVDAVVNGMTFYRGTGTPTFYTTLPVQTKLILAKDSLGRRLYPTLTDLASAMMVKEIVTVEPMEELDTLIGIVVNLADYNVGTDAGGEVSMFDQFDIDFNQQKYLIETRLSGALVKFKSAVIVNKVPGGDDLIDPVVEPTQSDNTVSGVNQTNVSYTVKDPAGNNITVTSGSFTLTSANSPATVVAAPASGYYFASDANDTWTFSYKI